MSQALPIWATEPVRIMPPDPAWPEKACRLQAELSGESITAIEHVGSTSVPDLPAKPIIDLVAEVPDFNDIDNIAKRLSSKEWHYVPPHLDQRPYRRLLIKVENDKRAQNQHSSKTSSR